MSKSVRSGIASILLSAGFLGVGFFEGQDRMAGILALSLITVPMTVWSFHEALGKNATLFTLILPAFYTFGVGIFWFLLPSSLLASVPVIVLYGAGIFGLLKTMNILAVSTYKKIALSRAARGVGFVLTLFTAFLLYDAVLSLKGSLLIRVPVVFLVSLPLLLQGLWTSELEQEVRLELIFYSSFFSLGITQVSIMLYFWPVSVVAGSLFLTVTMYVLLGLGQAKIEGRLFKATIREYLVVGALVLTLMILTTAWR